MTSLIKPFDPWRSPLCRCPPKYSLNTYTGCIYGCRYCYITSYIPNGFNPRVKKRLLERVEKDLDKLEDILPIAISFSTDPYQPLEARYRYTREVLKLLRERDIPVLIATKSPLVTRDIDILLDMDAVVSITITTIDHSTARLIEPYAPSPGARIKALETLSRNGIPTVLRIDPLIPGITDRETMLRKLVEAAYTAGVKHIVSSIYKAKPDNLKRVVAAYPAFKKIYQELYIGGKRSGYRYIDDRYAYNKLRFMKEIAEDMGLTFTTCRDGLEFLDTPGTYCDGSHLLRRKW